MIHGAVKLVKAAGKFIKGLFGKKDERKGEGREDDPEKAAKIAAGLSALNNRIATGEKEGKLTERAAREVAADVHRTHPVFSSVSVRDSAKDWVFTYSASEEKEAAVIPKAEEEGILEVSVTDSKPPGRSRVGALNLGEPKGYGYDPSDPHGGMGSPPVFEARVGEALSKVLKQPLPKKGPKGKLPAEVPRDPSAVLLVREPQLEYFRKEPDFIAVFGGKVGQIEVFEATLDANFMTYRSAEGSELSHKGVQLGGSVIDLARQYPDAPIIFNIVTHRPLSGELRTRVEGHLKTLRKQLAREKLKNFIQFIWRH